MTIDSLIAEMDKALQFPGVSNAWTMPIKARIDMLATGIRTPVGVKVYRQRSRRDRKARPPGRSGRCARCRARPAPIAERIIGGYYLNIEPDRAPLARYGLMIGDVQDVIATALGAEDGDHDGRRPRALQASTSAIRATCAAIRERSPTQVLIPLAERRHRAARRSGQDRTGAGPVHHPHRECTARRLYLRRLSATAISAATWPTRTKPWPTQVKFPPGLLRHLERSVRIYGTRQGAAARSSCRSRC